MSKTILMSPHMTREDMYHEALETFLRTSAGYMELDVLTDGLAGPYEPRSSVLQSADLT